MHNLNLLRRNRLRSYVAALLVGSAAACAQAFAESGDASSVTDFTVRWSVDLERSAPLYDQDQQSAPTAMLWLNRNRSSVGIGTATTVLSGTATTHAEHGVWVGIGYAPTRWASVRLSAPISRAPDAGDVPGVRLNMVPGKTLVQRARGALRFEIDKQTQVVLKPRRRSFMVEVRVTLD
jgi:hypothetical protein